MLKGRKIWILIFGLFLLDQLTKMLFYDYKIGQELWILEPVFNTGISRGLKLNAWIILMVSALDLDYLCISGEKNIFRHLFLSSCLLERFEI